MYTIHVFLQKLDGYDDRLLKLTTLLCEFFLKVCHSTMFALQVHCYGVNRAFGSLSPVRPVHRSCSNGGVLQCYNGPSNVLAVGATVISVNAHSSGHTCVITNLLKVCHVPSTVNMHLCSSLYHGNNLS